MAITIRNRNDGWHWVRLQPNKLDGWSETVYESATQAAEAAFAIAECYNCDIVVE